MVKPDNSAAVLQQMQVPGSTKGRLGETGVYVLGCHTNRVTLYAQQVRALNLIWALFDKGLLVSGQRVAVIGGGVAGLTAAAAAAVKECRVTVIERSHGFLHLQRGNSTRWLHPHIYDWPEPGSDRQTADLPLLNWSANWAGTVADRITEQWYALPAAVRERITEHHRARVQTIRGRKITWHDTEYYAEEEFDVIVMAVGFGVEFMASGLSPSYWRNDDLHQPIDTPIDTPSGTQKKVSFLVSGNGDGGLVDVLRLKLSNFAHDALTDLVAPVSDALRKSLRAIEAAAPTKNALWLFNEYKGLNVPSAIDEALRDRLRPDTTVTLNAVGASPIDQRSSILNRFLLTRLLKMKEVGYEPGRVVSMTLDAQGTEVTFEGGANRKFDRVVARHGPTPPAVADAIISAALVGFQPGTPDLTRTPYWGDFYVAAIPSGTSLARPSSAFTAASPADLVLLAKIQASEAEGRLFHLPKDFQRESAPRATEKDRALHFLLRGLRQRGLIAIPEGGRFRPGKEVRLTDLGRNEVFAFRGLEPETPSPLGATDTQWRARERVRSSIYENNRGLFLVHTHRPSTLEGQSVDIVVSLRQHGEGPLREGLVASVEYHLGKNFFTSSVVRTDESTQFALVVSAYAPALCLARVSFNDGSAAIDLHRYLDF